MATAINTPPRVRLVEVGPRDGLQNEKTKVPTEVNVAPIVARALAAKAPLPAAIETL
jgi:hypothetical protein